MWSPHDSEKKKNVCNSQVEGIAPPSSEDLFSRPGLHGPGPLESKPRKLPVLPAAKLREFILFIPRRVVQALHPGPCGILRHLDHLGSTHRFFYSMAWDPRLLQSYLQQPPPGLTSASERTGRFGDHHSGHLLHPLGT